MGPTVMLAVNDRQLLRVMADKLRQLHFEVIAAGNDREFNKLFATHDIDVILLDIRTRGNDGLRLMAEIRQTKPATEVILLSNQHSIAWAMEGMQAGAFDDITEPFDLDILSGKILAAWNRKKSLKRAGRNALALFFEKTMMAATFAQAGDFDTAERLVGKNERDKISGNTFRKRRK
ncbi:MAG: response regulator [Pseudomonadota bacterium]